MSSEPPSPFNRISGLPAADASESSAVAARPSARRGRRAPAVPWEAETVYFHGDEYFSDLLAEIEHARETIDVETYIFTRDEFGRVIEDALIDAARRGVRVRLLVDGIGALGWIGYLRTELVSLVEVRVYNPISFPWSWQALNQFLFHLNRRNHRKTFLIDRKVAWVSSMNISAAHLEQYLGREAWRDTGIRVRGPDAAILEVAFEHAWARAHGIDGKRHWRERLKFAKIPPTKLVMVNFTRKLRRRWRRELKRRIRGSAERVWITNPYFAPSPLILGALIAAAERGVDVRLVLPRKTDVFFMRWVVRSFYASLLAAGVRIYEYLPCILHAKSNIIDDWATVGTSNLNNRSQRRDLEADIVVTHPETMLRLAEQYDKDLEQSEEIRQMGWAQRIWLVPIGRLIIWIWGHWL